MAVLAGLELEEEEIYKFLEHAVALGGDGGGGGQWKRLDRESTVMDYFTFFWSSRGCSVLSTRRGICLSI